MLITYLAPLSYMHAYGSFQHILKKNFFKYEDHQTPLILIMAGDFFDLQSGYQHVGITDSH